MPLRDKSYTFYIYGLFTAENPSLFQYIGRTVNPNARLVQHNRWRKDNELSPVDMRIIDSIDTSEKCAIIERHYIHKYSTEGHPLSNYNHKDHICWPGCPRFDVSLQTSTTSVVVHGSVKTQCKAITKSGKQCRRWDYGDFCRSVHGEKRKPYKGQCAGYQGWNKGVTGGTHTYGAKISAGHKRRRELKGKQ